MISQQQIDALKRQVERLSRVPPERKPDDATELRIFVPDDGRNPPAQLGGDGRVVLYDPDRYPGGPPDDFPS